VSAQISPDGMFYWDGQQWVSTLSPDGRSRWNGTAWVPTGHAYGPPAYQATGRTLREPTSIRYASVRPPDWSGIIETSATVPVRRLPP